MNEYLKNLVQLIFAPARGWEDMAIEEREKFLDYRNRHLGETGGKHGASFHDEEDAWSERHASHLFRSCFLPAIGVCACSSFIKMFYEGGPGFLGALQMAIITFVSLFLSTQFARYVFQTYMPRLLSEATVEKRGRWMSMIMYCVTFLGIITLVSNVVKVRIALIEFLPLYVVFILWKGWRYAGVEERNIGLFMIMATASVLGSAYLVSFLLNALV